jgi:hypothetical protein
VHYLFLNHRTNRTRQTGENQAGGTAKSRPCCPKLSLTDCAICTRSGKKGVSHVEQKKNWARLKQHPNERRLWFSFNISRDWYFNKWRDGGWLKKMHIILLLHKIRSCVCVRDRGERNVRMPLLVSHYFDVFPLNASLKKSSRVGHCNKWIVIRFLFGRQIVYWKLFPCKLIKSKNGKSCKINIHET